MKRFLVFLIFVFFVVNICNAAGILLYKDKPTKFVMPNETAEFEIRVKNNQNTADLVQLSLLEYKEFSLVEGVISIWLEPGQQEFKKIHLKPSPKLTPGRYNVFLKATGRLSEEEKVIGLEVIVMDPSKLFDINFIAPEIDPRREARIVLELENNYGASFENITANLESSIFKSSKMFSIAPYGNATLEYKISLNPDTEEGNYSVNVIFFKDKKIISNASFNIVVARYQGLTEISTKESSLLIKKEIIEKRNTGNALITENFTREFSLFKKIITSTNPKPDTITKKDGTYIYIWQISLQPEESTTITIRTNYRTPLIIIVVLAVVIVLLRFKFKKDIIVKKRVLALKPEKGIAKLKVLINVINKSKKKIKDIKIMERVPFLEAPKEFGTLKPSKMYKSGGALTLVWKIDELSPKEERVFSYKLETKAKVIGKIPIPPTLARYEKKKKIIIVKSNKVGV